MFVDIGRDFALALPLSLPCRGINAVVPPLERFLCERSKNAKPMYFKVSASVSEKSKSQKTLLNEQVFSLYVAAFYLVALFACIAISLVMNKGTFVYPLDDTYIHMTIARNLALHGTWGMDPQIFSSASSSILYTLLLAGIYYLTVPNIFVPLIINVIASLLIIFYFQKIARVRQVDAWYFLFILFMLVLGVSMIPLTMSGMEHTLQILFGLIFIYEAAGYIERNERKILWKLLALSALATMIRYEGIFIVGIVAFIMVLRRQYGQAGLILLASLVPVVLFGLYSLSQGGYFLPNSLLLKGATPEMSAKGLYMFSVGWLIKLIEDPHLGELFGVLVFLLMVSTYQAKEKWKLENVLVWILIMLFIAHLTFARTGWFYRYEAYLMAFAFFTFMLAGKPMYGRIREFLDRHVPLRTRSVLVILAIPLLFRGLYTIRNTPLAMNNIYSQQYQMARFVQEYDPRLKIVLNDIGAVSYYNNIGLLDFFGLANKDVLDMKRSDQFTKPKIDALARGENIELALIYDYENRTPDTWVKIGEWTIRHNVVCENPTVALYLIDLRKKQEVVKAFDQYVRTLPEGVTYETYF